jgi:hypothetical protein
MHALFFCLLAMLTGCGEKQPATPGKAASPRLPRITHFYGNQTVVPKGGNLTLCYGTEDVETLTLRPHEDGELRPSLNRCVGDTPKKDTTYTLTAKGPGGETTATFSVRVGPPPRPQKETVLIQNFQVLGDSPMRAGGRVQLCYSTEGANRVSIRPRVRSALKVGKNQCVVVSPAKTTTYILTATAADGSVDRMQVSVPVQ